MHDFVVSGHCAGKNCLTTPFAALQAPKMHAFVVSGHRAGGIVDDLFCCAAGAEQKNMISSLCIVPAVLLTTRFAAPQAPKMH